MVNMIDITIPGGQELTLKHLVLDYNGTIAADGELLPGVSAVFTALAKLLNIHVITADTHGNVGEKLKEQPCTIEIIGETAQDCAKRDYVRRLGAESVAAVGNGRNDILMLQEAALGICVVQTEGCFSQTIVSSDVVCTSIMDAFNLLLIPKRLTATLRN